MTTCCQQLTKDIEDTFRRITECLERLSYDNPLVALLDYDLDESESKHLCLDIKEYIIKVEQLDLSLREIAQGYHKSFTTKYPNIFKTFCEQQDLTKALLNELLAECELHGITQEAGEDLKAKTQEAGEALKAKTQEADEDLKAKTQEADEDQPSPTTLQLFRLIRQLANAIDHTRKLCDKTMRREQQTKLMPKLCLKLFETEYQETKENIQSLITYNSIPVGTKQDPISIALQKAKGKIEEMVCQCYHTFSPADMHLYVVCDIMAKRMANGLSKTELAFWPDDHDTARKVRYLIEHFDELGVEGKLDTKQNKRHLNAKYIGMLMKWAKLLEATSKVSVPKFYEYFLSVYHGNLLPPSTSGLGKHKRGYSDQEYKDFAEKMEALLQGAAPGACIIPLAGEV